LRYRSKFGELAWANVTLPAIIDCECVDAPWHHFWKTSCASMRSRAPEVFDAKLAACQLMRAGKSRAIPVIANATLTASQALAGWTLRAINVSSMLVDAVMEAAGDPFETRLKAAFTGTFISAIFVWMLFVTREQHRFLHCPAIMSQVHLETGTQTMACARANFAAIVQRNARFALPAWLYNDIVMGAPYALALVKGQEGRGFTGRGVLPSLGRVVSVVLRSWAPVHFWSYGRNEFER